MNDDQDFETLKRDFNDLIPTALRIQCGPGWAKIIHSHLAEIRALLPERHSVRVAEIKQKHGALIIEYENDAGLPQKIQQELEKSVLLADARSENTCEECGARGYLRDIHGWLRTTCEAHGEGASIIENEGIYNVGDKTYRYDQAADAFIHVTS